MKKKLLSLLPYALVLAADFYLLPLLMRDTGTAMLLLLCLIPVIAFCCGVMCGVRLRFQPLLALTAMVLFVPGMFLFMNATAWPYVFAYGAAVLAGNGLGCLFYRKR